MRISMLGAGAVGGRLGMNRSQRGHEISHAFRSHVL